MTRNLLRVPNHPLSIVKKRIERSFPDFARFDDLNPLVTTRQNFDDLLIPADHPSRSPSDTFYVDDKTCLRTHTSAHQTELLRGGLEQFLVFGSVYRRDEVDATHFPVFHQMEGVRILPKGATKDEAFRDLKSRLEHMTRDLFSSSGDASSSSSSSTTTMIRDQKWVDAYFPFTQPSAELEITIEMAKDGVEPPSVGLAGTTTTTKNLEVLGCGVIHDEIMQSVGLSDRVGWAFGLGIERLAMVLFSIPDIRLFWSEDPRFISQFRDERGEDKIARFAPFSKYPASTRDVSFWIPRTDRKYHPNDFFSLVRERAGDVVESVSLLDEFTHPKTKRQSKAYRIVYRSMERTLTAEEVNNIQREVENGLRGELGVEIR